LREGQPFALYAMRRIHEVLDNNAIFRVLRPDCVPRRVLELGEVQALNGAGGLASGLEVEAFAVPGKIALYLEDPEAGPGFGTREGDTVGLKVSETATGASFFFIPSCAALTPELAARLEGAQLVFFDGTLWRDDELIAAGVGTKTGERMGHVAIAEPGGPLDAFATLGIERKVFVHVNNTNPVWLRDAPERAAAEEAGWTVAEDGMEFSL
jgi:pyrroloquinoline quinone biosynthesis protein B